MLDTTRAPAESDINQRIARRVRTLRAGLELSLAALEARCGVSRSMLSLVERGEASPSAVVLEKIAAGLRIPLASLFDDEDAPVSPLGRSAARASWRDPQSGYIRRNLSPPHFPSPLRLVEVVLPAGAQVAYESSAREEALHQQVWVLEGRIEVTAGTITHELGPDDCLAMRVDDGLAFRNRSKKRARYLVAIAADGAAKR